MGRDGCSDSEIDERDHNENNGENRKRDRDGFAGIEVRHEHSLAALSRAAREKGLTGWSAVGQDLRRVMRGRWEEDAGRMGRERVLPVGGLWSRRLIAAER